METCSTAMAVLLFALQKDAAKTAPAWDTPSHLLMGHAQRHAVTGMYQALNNAMIPTLSTTMGAPQHANIRHVLRTAAAEGTLCPL